MSDGAGFPRFTFATQDTTFFDIEPFVLKAMREINLAVDEHAKEVLREAFLTGFAAGAMENCNSALGFPVTPADDLFADWLDTKRCQIR